ncbi:hypothetical protein BDV3_005680 [Batrachochytrium dendrobatidis]|nr:farnesyl cysteine-carboxyl methyltransferase [Batrachochytrium dendrobatidis]KAK5673492.1 farnesyl cysteine-carboxyl methyltransferase [Batrachochytrium dendrobatidis]
MVDQPTPNASAASNKSSQPIVGLHAKSAACSGPFGLNIFDARHTAQNVAANAFLLGIVAGYGMLLSAMASNLHSGVHVCSAMAMFVSFEYIQSAILGEAESLAAFSFPKPYAVVLLLAVGFFENAVWQILLGSSQSHMSVLLAYIGYTALLITQIFRVIARVGPLMKYTQIKPFVTNSKLIFPYWSDACASSLFWWVMSAQIAQRSIIGVALVVYLKDLLKSSSVDAYVWPEVIKNKNSFRGFLGLPLYDGLHTCQNIASYAFCLGFVAGCGCAIGTFTVMFRGLGIFLASLTTFHIMEYITTAMFQPDTSLKSFLLNHSPEYHIAMAGGIIEFLVETFFFPSFKVFSWINGLGFLVVIASQILRSVAMITAGSNFTHYISEDKKEDHILITTGIYAYLRHPSYTGFYYWSLGQQILLGNPACFVAYMFCLYTFFNSRIRFEERKLVEFFGDVYKDYRKTSYVLIPGIH